MLVAVVSVVSGCAPAPSAVSEVMDDRCLDVVGETRHVRFPVSGGRLRAVVVGRGATGVVLANETTNDDCHWSPFPQYLAGRGYRVLAFDYGSGDRSSEVRAAARYLRSRGAHRLVLIGASIGGAVVIDAAVHLHPAPVAVVSLSAVLEATRSPVLLDARRLRSPIFQIGSAGDLHTRQGADTVALYRASPSPARRLLLLPGTSHGVHLVAAGAGNRVRLAIVAFLRAHTHG